MFLINILNNIFKCQLLISLKKEKEKKHMDLEKEAGQKRVKKF